MNRRKSVLGIIIFWLILLIGFIIAHAYILKTGEVVILKTAPVDPRDLFRGDYVILNYDISTIKKERFVYDKREVGDHVYVTLEEGVGYYFVDEVFPTQPNDVLFLKGQIKSFSGNSTRIEYGIESYFVPEGTGKAIERHIGDMKVKIAIGKNGKGVIKELMY